MSVDLLIRASALPEFSTTFIHLNYMDITGKVDIIHENHESEMLVMVPTIYFTCNYPK
jgi:hypothetical protein